MGVKGLLPTLQSITKQVSLEKYKGLTAAVDAMCWLHKGIFTGDVASLAKYQFLLEQVEDSREDASYHEEGSEQKENRKSEESRDERKMNMNNNSNMPIKRLDFDTCLTRRKPKNDFSRTKEDDHLELPGHILELQNNAKKASFDCIEYVIRQTNALRNDYGIEPILVIDGNELPSKANTNAERKRNRAKAFQDGLKCERKQNHREARKYFAKACSITHEMRHELVLLCRRQNISYIIAPYEADAQLAHLAHSGVADFVITEDSDLLVYAVPRVLFKVDLKMGKGYEIQIMRDLASNDGLNFRHWNHDMFVYMCILTGCDYFRGVTGVGIQIAHKLVRIHRKPSKIFDAMKRGGKWKNDSSDAFWMAYRTFRHQRIFCTESNCIKTLFPIENNIVDGIKVDPDDMWPFLGDTMKSEIALGVANGSLHPVEKIPWNAVLEGKELELRRTCDKASIVQPLFDFCLKSPEDNKRHSNMISEKKRNQISPIKDNIFSFFRPSKRMNEEKTARLPLREIKVSSCSISNSVATNVDGFNLLGSKIVPSNANLYSSNLVAKTFEPMTRIYSSKRNQNILEKKSGVTRAIHQLKEKLSLKKILEREKQRSEHLHMQKDDEKRRREQKEEEEEKKRQEKIEYPFEEGDGFFHDCGSVNDHYSFDYGFDNLRCDYNEEMKDENYADRSDNTSTHDENWLTLFSTKEDESNISHPLSAPYESQFSTTEKSSNGQYDSNFQFISKESDACFDYIYHFDDVEPMGYHSAPSNIFGSETTNDSYTNNQTHEDAHPPSSLWNVIDRFP